MHGIITDNTKDKPLKDIFPDTEYKDISSDILRIADINLYDEKAGNIFLLGRKTRDKIEKKNIL